MPPFFCNQWKLHKAGEGTTWNSHYSRAGFDDCSSFIAAPGSVIEYINNPMYFCHSRDRSSGDVKHSSYQFEGGERVLITKRHFLYYSYPVAPLNSGKRQYGWLLMLKSYLLNDLEFFDAIYE